MHLRAFTGAFLKYRKNSDYLWIRFSRGYWRKYRNTEIMLPKKYRLSSSVLNLSYTTHTGISKTVSTTSEIQNKNTLMQIINLRISLNSIILLQM